MSLPGMTEDMLEGEYLTLLTWHASCLPILYVSAVLEGVCSEWQNVVPLLLFYIY